MITLKILKPYHIKVDESYIRLKLEHQFFSIYVNGEEYQFIPSEAKEIIINRKSKKIDNVNARFVFKNSNDIICLSMEKLIYHPDFLNQVYNIAKPYYYKEILETGIDKTALEFLIDELEENNKKRLIDKALDEKNENMFYKLVQKN